MTTSPFQPTDLALSRRLERAEARANASFVEARARLTPGSGATWIDVHGTYAMFDGVGSPITQTFGLGLFAPATAADLDAIEGFFEQRGAEAFHEVSPLADLGLLHLLPSRGYRPIELTSVMHQPLADRRRASAPVSAVRARPIGPREEELWAETSSRGWGETAELAAFMRGFGLVSAHSASAICFIAELDGEPIAAGTMALHEGVALLAGASTIPAFRRRGAQAALLDARLRHAADQGCDIAMMGALPGSTSQQNAERQGFRIAYTRIKWGRGAATA